MSLSTALRILSAAHYLTFLVSHVTYCQLWMQASPVHDLRSQTLPNSASLPQRGFTELTSTVDAKASPAQSITRNGWRWTHRLSPQ